METILFGKPVFKEGLNFTVRLGDKWKNRLCIGQNIKLAGLTENDVIRIGQIQKIYSVKMADVPEEVFENEHDPDCHDVIGLSRAMVKAYPQLSELSCPEYDEMVVTCIGFEIVGRA